MNTIAFVNIPAYGHVNPTLPVVHELVRRGERVIYYNAEEFRPQIEPTGAELRPYPDGAVSAAAINAAVESGNIANVPLLLMRAADALLPFLLDDLKQQQPDVLVFDSTALWGRMAATLLNVRAVGSITTFVFDTPMRGMALGELLRLFGQIVPSIPAILSARSRLLRDYPQAAFLKERPLFPMRGDLNLLFTSRELQPPSPLIDETFRFVGPSIDPETRGGDFPFETLGAGPLIYISLGTVHVGHLDFFRECFAAFADVPAQFILSTGKGTDLSQIGPVPPNFIVRPTVPQLEILQRADVFVTHAGINSVHEGLYYGVPLMMVPQQAEQLLNAACVAGQGAGVVLRQRLSNRRVKAADLRQALDTIRADARYRAAAARLQASLRATGGYQQAADEIQAFIATGRGKS